MVTLEDGTEIETFSQDELEAQTQEALAEKEAEVEAAKAQLAELSEKLEKANEKDRNFAKLREQKNKAEALIEQLKQETEEKLVKVKKEILESVSKDYYNEVLNQLSGDDEELKKKIVFEYGRLSDIAGTKEEISKKLRDAYTLAARVETEGVSASVFSSGGASAPAIKRQGTFSDDEKDLARRLAAAGGLTLEESDFNK